MKLTNTRPRPPAKFAVVGPPNSGKTVFICSNCALPVWGLDADGRFPDYLNLLTARSDDPGDIPDDPSIYFDTIRLQEETRQAQKGGRYKALVVDSMTKPFQGLARLGHMKNRASKAGEGEKGNFADRLQDKALFVSSISSLTSLFEENWLVWHTYDRRNQDGKEEKGETLSKTERERLLQSLSGRLEFGFDAKGYWVKPVWARDWRGIKANVGFTLYDHPEGYWAGGLDRLFAVMYASFAGQADALAWAAKQTGQTVEQLTPQYVATKEGVTSARDMWVKWALVVDALK